MNTLTILKEEFKQGEIEKADYISSMHNNHKRLFEYSEFIKDTDISKIEIEDGSVVMTTRELGIKIVCDKFDERIIPLEILNFGEFEGDELRMIRKMVLNGQTFFDIGANLGWYSLNLAKSFPDATIAAFEPVPSTYKYLLSNLSRNEATKVKTYNFGLSNEEGNKDMYYYKEGMGNASLSNLSERETVEKISTPFTTLDTFSSEYNLRPDFIKCDVEGAELFVFQGAVEVLKRDKPTVFTEILRKWSAKFNYHPNDILDLFAGLGYFCYVIEGDTLRKFDRVDENTIATNYMFVHKDKMSDLGIV